MLAEPTPTPPTSHAAEYPLYLPLISRGIVAQGANVDFDAPDFDAAVDNGVAEPTTEEISEETTAEDELYTSFDPTELEQLNAAALDGSAGTIASSEDYRALGYPDGRKIVRNSQGDLYVAYRKKRNNRYRIFVAESTDNGTTWQPLGNSPIEDVGDYTQRVPALAIDAQDRLHLVWYGNDAQNGDPQNISNEREIKYSRSTPTTAATIHWTPWRNLYDGQGYGGERLWQEHPTITVWQENIYVVWESVERGLGEIKYIFSDSGGDTWQAVVTVQPSTQLYFSRPTLQTTTVNGKITLFLVAYGTKAGIARLYYSRSDDNGANWSKWVAVASAKADQRHASLAVDGAGKIHIVWRQVQGKTTILRYRVYDPAKRRGKGSWDGGARTIAAVRRTCLYFPTIAISGNGTAWVVWTQSSDLTTLPNDEPTTGQLFMATAAAGQSRWSKPMALTTAGEHLYGSLRRATPPTAMDTTIDLVWLDRSASPVDEMGQVTCAADSCVLRYARLNDTNNE
ncbi:MAG: exo-alpha-sialidase [Caldilineaceae bacterium]|nr:exo-alpha-sialidase [Caldilineaceae bacterium]